jgi:hypothetical protein
MSRRNFGAPVRLQGKQRKPLSENSSDFDLMRATVLQARGLRHQSHKFRLTNRLPDITASTAFKRSLSIAVFKT